MAGTVGFRTADAAEGIAGTTVGQEIEIILQRTSGTGSVGICSVAMNLLEIEGGTVGVDIPRGVFPTTITWADGDSEDKILRVPTLGPWNLQGPSYSVSITLNLDDQVNCNIDGSAKETAAAITAGTITGEAPEPESKYSLKFVSNKYSNMSSQQERQTTTQVPFSKGSNTPLNLRGRTTPYHVAAGGAQRRS
jgi:hypothetical protein|tara:strand:- start:85 stop:663 length:579 start_codon:yes stop_codon:yes gene_type:complete